jgi:hypothetical protein
MIIEKKIPLVDPQIKMDEYPLFYCNNGIQAKSRTETGRETPKQRNVHSSALLSQHLHSYFSSTDAFSSLISSRNILHLSPPMCLSIYEEEAQKATVDTRKWDLKDEEKTSRPACGHA